MRNFKISLCFLFVLSFLFFSADSFFLPKKQELKPVEKVPYDYDLSSYISLGDLDQLTAEFEDPTVCTEKEIDQAIFRILLEKATFTEKSVPAARYYKVKIDFSIEKDGQILPTYTQTDYELIIGYSEENEIEYLLGEKLMGAVIGEERRVSYTYPEELLGSVLSGQEVTLCAKVKAVYPYELPTLNNRTVGEVFSGAFQTVDELRESVKQDILKEKVLARAKAVWLALLDQVRVRSYPEEELSDYKTLYRKNYEEMAEKYSLTLSQFVENYLETDMEGFLAEGEEAAREKVKNDMIFIQLVRTLKVTLTEEEYEAGAQKYFLEEENEFNSFEEFEEYYTKENLEQNILWDKALGLLIEKVQAKK